MRLTHSNATLFALTVEAMVVERPLHSLTVDSSRAARPSDRHGKGVVPEKTRCLRDMLARAGMVG
jgi:hypothetical protein